MVAKTRRSRTAAATQVDGLEVDLSKVTAREMGEFFQAARENDMDTLAEIFAQVVVACPYGDPTEVDTYLDLPFFGGFQDVLEAVVEASKNVRPR